ncbi:MAG: hypothetical protein U0T81_01200 [Saprospiraceae bacterium]
MKIVFEPYATPLAGADIQVCGLNYKLDGQLSFGNANWRKLTGPANAPLWMPRSHFGIKRECQRSLYI